jgi:hypothetical protein
MTAELNEVTAELTAVTAGLNEVTADQNEVTAEITKCPGRKSTVRFFAAILFI